MHKDTTISKDNTFKGFLVNNYYHQVILCIALIAIVVQFSVFKYLYPFASYIHGDSFSYINAAYENLNINTYMVGYSKFLRFFSVFSTSDSVLVAFQYLLIQVAALFLLFTIFYFYNIARVTQYVISGFMIFNPLFLHLANLISSDCLFTALSLIWFTLILWIIHQPNTRLIIWQSLVLFLAFTFRYNALIYPFIAALAYCLSPLPLRKKLVGITLGVVLCGMFIVYTCTQYKRLTGYWQFSPFSGWQLANNAMYSYRYVDKVDRKPVPKNFRILDKMIVEYFDSTRDIKKFPVEELQASSVYMWTKELSLYKYRDQLFNKKDSSAGEFKRWATMGPFYKDYGTYIIQQYPWHFLQYFIWPNAIKYYAPPVEFLEEYNSGNSYVTRQTKEWFQYPSQKVNTRTKNNNIWVLNFFPILSGVINVVMFFVLIFYIVLKGWRHSGIFKKGIYLGSSLWLANAVFTIGASSAALRFQSFPILLTTTFVALLLDWLWKVAMNSQSALLKSETLNTQFAEVSR